MTTSVRRTHRGSSSTATAPSFGTSSATPVGGSAHGSSTYPSPPCRGRTTTTASVACSARRSRSMRRRSRRCIRPTTCTSASSSAPPTVLRTAASCSRSTHVGSRPLPGLPRSLTERSERDSPRPRDAGDELGRELLEAFALDTAMEPVDPLRERTPTEEVLARLVEVEQRGPEDGRYERPAGWDRGDEHGGHGTEAQHTVTAGDREEPIRVAGFAAPVRRQVHRDVRRDPEREGQHRTLPARRADDRSREDMVGHEHPLVLLGGSRVRRNGLAATPLEPLV